MGAGSTWAEVLTDLVCNRDLSTDQTGWAMGEILAGQASPVHVAAFAVALRTKGETVTELAGMADQMLQFASPLNLSGRCVDVVGSGADRANTVNISTMAGIVGAGAGARVAKHGNRAASSACGTADVLEELGVALSVDPARQPAILDECGIVFLFAPLYHPSLRHAAATRRELGISTTFNFLGPLANPARPAAQAVGLADPRAAELVAGVLASRGVDAVVFHGGDGLDELTTTTESAVWLVAKGQVSRHRLDPLDLGLSRSHPEQLVGGQARHNADVVLDLLAGAPGPVRDIVVLNAAATLVAYEGPRHEVPLVDQLGPQLERAAEAIDSGAARTTLKTWAAATQRG